MATAAAAVAARARRTVIDHLLVARAVSPETAISYTPARRIERSQLERLTRRGVFHQTLPGTYWVDLPAYVDWRAAQRRRIAFVMVAIAIVLVAVILLIPRH